MWIYLPVVRGDDGFQKNTSANLGAHWMICYSCIQEQLYLENQNMLRSRDAQCISMYLLCIQIFGLYRSNLESIGLSNLFQCSSPHPGGAKVIVKWCGIAGGPGEQFDPWPTIILIQSSALCLNPQCPCVFAPALAAQKATVTERLRLGLRWSFWCMTNSTRIWDVNWDVGFCPRWTYDFSCELMWMLLHSCHSWNIQ